MVDISTVEYPLYKYYHSLEYVLKNYQDLKIYHYDYIEVDKKRYKYTIYFLNIDFKRDEKYLRITDYFSEECRVKCNFADMISPQEYFNINKETIIRSLGETPKYKDIDDYLYNHGPIQCSNFDTIVCTSVLRHFKPTRWLDPSAGWGDRLISAINYGECEYRATDPNECLHPKYKKIIETLAEEINLEDERGSRPKYNITQEGFETADIEANYYDLVFTSPPFFDLEKYSNSPTQSHIKFSTLEEWMDGFMLPFLIKCVASLMKGGHLCLYVEDNKKSGTYYVKNIKNYLNNNKRMKFIGFITWQASSKPRKIMVYQKIKK